MTLCNNIVYSGNWV